MSGFGNQLLYGELPSPIDELRLVFRHETIVHLDFADNDARIAKSLRRRFGATTPRHAAVPAYLSARLDAYFAGELDALARVDVDTGGSPFQRDVWAELAAIPPGVTRSYGEVGAAIGLARGMARAVGAAVGANPVSLVVPCHRVVGSDGRLVGYAGGLERKRWLLCHEARGTCAGAGAGV